MLRLTHKLFRFSSTYYTPCNFDFKSSPYEQVACVLSNYISYYRRYGHHYAKLDPLGIHNKVYEDFVKPTDLGISFQDQLGKYKCNDYPLVKASKTVGDLQNNLKRAYLNNVGVEFDHVDTIEQREWLYHNYEKIMIQELSPEKKIKLATTLIEAEALDHFLHKKFVTFKRYSGEGAQTTVLSLAQLFQSAAHKGFTDVVFGMPHRGRLNTLVNILQYPASLLFRKIGGNTDTPIDLHTVNDDVVSHIAQSIEKDYQGKKIKVTMVHNPSHLEAQNPVSMGKARSKMINHSQDDVLNIQVHGDSAICAQGIVYESFLLGRVPKYTINGSIHIITNNQLGYTTKPIDSRSTKYASDVAKGFNIPVLHVNAQNVEDVSRVMEFCLEYRRKFKKDILVDLICYRKYGHNEVDEPEFTQPKLYHQIRKVHKPSTQTYAQALESQGLTKNLYEQVRKVKFEKYEKQFDLSKTIKRPELKEFTSASRRGAKAFTHQWKGFKPALFGQQYPTGFDIQLLKQFALASVFIPTDFNIHARIKKYHIEERIKSISSNKLNWATCQALAFYSLNFEGYNIRFTGQDVERGTFSQRHINLVNQSTEQEFNALDFHSKQAPGRGKVDFYNSPLTQNAAMSFEYGYSIDNPLNFVCWEAQFGDFFNTAQVVIDTYLTNSQSKWMRQTGLALILPHGFDGAGPQHSSCRIERFLQLANSDGSLPYLNKVNDVSKQLKLQDGFFYENHQTANFSFVYPTKPANIYHVLRRQMKRNFRSPLIVAGPKGLLRNSSCVSTFEDLGPNSKFEEIIGYYNSDKVSNAKTIFLCSGKFVYDVENLIKEAKSQTTSLFTIQELFPFPEQKLQSILKNANKDAQIFWIQQENFNGGAFNFVQPRINRALKKAGLNQEIKYVGRRAVSTTAVGSSEIHKKQLEQLNNWIKKIIQ